MLMGHQNQFYKSVIIGIVYILHTSIPFSTSSTEYYWLFK